jgi:hypothetical protein
VTSDGEPTPKRRRKRWPYLVGVVAFLIAAGAIVYEPLVRKIVRKRALAAGVDLHCRDIRYRFSAATVGACRATLLGADGIELVLETAVVDLAGMSPTAVHARNAVVTLDATFPTLLSSLNEWRRRYPTLTSLPLDGEIISIVWRRPHPGWNATVSLPRAAMDPELRAGEIDGARVAVTAEGTEPTKQPTLRLDGITGSWRDDRIKLGVGIVDLQLASTDAAKPRRVMLGPIAASWDGERAGIDLGLGGPDAKNPPIRLELERAKRRVVVAVPEQELDWLTSPFGVSIPVRGVRASSRVEIALGEDPWRGEIGGSLSARVAGWLPAHPAEIDGFLRGDGIGVTADAKLAADRQSVQLPRVDVAIGAIALRGRGDVRREGNDTRPIELRGDRRRGGAPAISAGDRGHRRACARREHRRGSRIRRGHRRHHARSGRYSHQAGDRPGLRAQGARTLVAGFGERARQRAAAAAASTAAAASRSETAEVPAALIPPRGARFRDHPMIASASVGWR